MKETINKVLKEYKFKDFVTAELLLETIKKWHDKELLLKETGYTVKETDNHTLELIGATGYISQDKQEIMAKDATTYIHELLHLFVKIFNYEMEDEEECVRTLEYLVYNELNLKDKSVTETLKEGAESLGKEMAKQLGGFKKIKLKTGDKNNSVIELEKDLIIKIKAAKGFSKDYEYFVIELTPTIIDLILTEEFRKHVNVGDFYLMWNEKGDVLYGADRTLTKQEVEELKVDNG